MGHKYKSNFNFYIKTVIKVNYWVGKAARKVPPPFILVVVYSNSLPVLIVWTRCYYKGVFIDSHLSGIVMMDSPSWATCMAQTEHFTISRNLNDNAQKKKITFIAFFHLFCLEKKNIYIYQAWALYIVHCTFVLLCGSRLSIHYFGATFP